MSYYTIYEDIVIHEKCNLMEEWVKNKSREISVYEMMTVIADVESTWPKA